MIKCLTVALLVPLSPVHPTGRVAASGAGSCVPYPAPVISRDALMMLLRFALLGCPFAARSGNLESERVGGRLFALK